MLQEAEGRNDAAIKRIVAEAVSETAERHPGALGGATAAALRSAERARNCQLRTAASSGQAAKKPTARVTTAPHCCLEWPLKSYAGNTVFPGIAMPLSALLVSSFLI